MASFFERLQRANRLYETSAPAYLRTHPLTYERIADIESRLEKMPYKQIRDNGDFQAIRARIKSMDGTPSDAIAWFQSQLREKKYANESAVQYGLALAYVRANRPDEAEPAIQRAARLNPSPLTSLLLAQVAAKNSKPELALSRFRSGLSTYPNYRPLLYGYADTLLENHKALEALTY